MAESDEIASMTVTPRFCVRPSSRATCALTACVFPRPRRRQAAYACSDAPSDRSSTRPTSRSSATAMPMRSSPCIPSRRSRSSPRPSWRPPRFPYSQVSGEGRRPVHARLRSRRMRGDGAYGVVLNAPASYTTLEMVSRVIDIPVIVTVVDADRDVVANRIAAGASILNVAAGAATAQVVADIREEFPDVPLIATAARPKRAFARRSRRARTRSSARPRPTRSCSRE